MSKTALVTGGSEGIGRALAVRLAKEGFIVTAVARNEGKLKELVTLLGPSHSYHIADLSSREGQDKVQKIIELGRFDLLINNAGIGTVGGFTDVFFEKQMEMFHLNCEAVVRFSYAFLKNSKRGDGLVNVSSALAFMPTPSMALYCATKAFVTSLSESLWYEQEKRGVYVMGLCPGITETNFQVTAGGRKEDLPKSLSQTAEHVADVAYKALQARQNPTILTGVKNVIFTSLSRMLSRKRVVKMTGGMMPS
jgi:short-subunit dehydrogenase